MYTKYTKNSKKASWETKWSGYKLRIKNSFLKIIFQVSFSKLNIFWEGKDSGLSQTFIIVLGLGLFTMEPLLSGNNARGTETYAK